MWNDEEYDRFEISPLGKLFHEFMARQAAAYQDRHRAERTGLPNDRVRAEMSWHYYDLSGQRLCHAMHVMQQRLEEYEAAHGRI